MDSIKLSSKGQVIIPKHIRSADHWEPGQELILIDTGNGILLKHTSFNEHDVFIADTVILETAWVPRFAYNFDTKQIAGALTKLFGLPNVHINHPSLFAQAIAWHLQGLVFAEVFHLANSRHCKTFFTFDKKMINAAKNTDTC